MDSLLPKVKTVRVMLQEMGEAAKRCVPYGI